MIQVILLFFEGTLREITIKIRVYNSCDNRDFNKKPMGKDGISAQIVLS